MVQAAGFEFVHYPSYDNIEIIDRVTKRGELLSRADIMAAYDPAEPVREVIRRMEIHRGGFLNQVSNYGGLLLQRPSLHSQLGSQQHQMQQGAFAAAAANIPTQYIGPKDSEVKVSSSNKPKQGESKMFGVSLREYFQKHRDLFFTIGIVILIDHFVFEGALKSKVQQFVEKILDGASKKFHKDNESSN